MIIGSKLRVGPACSRLRLSVLGLALLIACSGDAGSADAASEEQLSMELAAVAEDMLAAVRAREADRVISYYDTASFIHFENGHSVSWSELAPQMRSFMGSAARIDLVWLEAPRVVLLGPDAALVHGIHSFEGALQDGTVLPDHTGTWSGVFRRTGGQWKLIHSHSSEAEQ